MNTIESSDEILPKLKGSESLSSNLENTVEGFHVPHRTIGGNATIVRTAMSFRRIGESKKRIFVVKARFRGQTIKTFDTFGRRRNSTKI